MFNISETLNKPLRWVLYREKTNIYSVRNELFSAFMDLSGGTVVKNPLAKAEDTRDAGSISGLGRSPGEGNENPLQFSCLENSMDREAW